MGGVARQHATRDASNARDAVEPARAELRRLAGAVESVVHIVATAESSIDEASAALAAERLRAARRDATSALLDLQEAIDLLVDRLADATAPPCRPVSAVVPVGSAETAERTPA